MRLEDLQPLSTVREVHPDGAVTVVSVQWFGSEALELTYKTATRAIANELPYHLKPSRIDGPEIQNLRLGQFSTPVSEQDLLPSAIVHLLPVVTAPTCRPKWGSSSGP